jgi:GNAT superfamily N-acetyltransferase
MNGHEKQVTSLDFNRLETSFRPATENDAGAIIKLVTAKLDIIPGLNEFYSRPSVDSWRNSFIKKGKSFLNSHVIVDVELNGIKILSAGYTRVYRFPAAEEEECGYIKGPWVDPSLDEKLILLLERELVVQVMDKMQKEGLILTRVQIPLLLPKRLALFKDFLNFHIREKIFSYERLLGTEQPREPSPLSSIDFSLYTGEASEDHLIIELHNACFPNERVTLASFIALKGHYNDFKGNCSIHVARADGNIVGMTWSDCRQRPDGVVTCEISDLAVHPAYRKRGIARSLVFRSLQQAWKQGINLVTTSISDFNQPSIKTFESCGFTCQPLSGQEILEKKLVP